jgi:hypothetical protein
MEEHRTPNFPIRQEPVKKNYTWLYILIIIVSGGLNVYQFLNSGSSSEKKADKHQNQAEIHQDSSLIHFEQYKGRIVKDSVLEKSYDSLLNVKNQIKPQYYEKYKVVNTYSVSDMQSYFDDRTAESTTKK